jgi:hypothetical protein
MDYNLFGGKVIDSGGYGCIFKPAITCKNSNKTKKNIVSKLLPSKIASREHLENNKIKNILKKIPNWKQYYIFSIVSCQPKNLTTKDLKDFNKKCKTLTRKKYYKKTINSKIDELQILQFPYGGSTLEKYIFKEIKNEPSLFNNLNENLIRFLNNAIIPMNKLNCYHLDIKDTNILIGENNKLKLIDWGISTTTKNTIPKHIFNKSIQFNYPFTSILLNKDFIDDLNTYLSNDYNNKEDLKLYLKNYYIDKITPVSSEGHIEYLSTIFNKFNKNIDIYDVVFDYCSNCIEKNIIKGIFDFEGYFSNIFLKKVDIWGFLTIYMSFLLNNDNNNKNFHKNIENLLFKHLFNSYEKYDITELNNDLKSLTTSINKKQSLEFIDKPITPTTKKPNKKTFESLNKFT